MFIKLIVVSCFIDGDKCKKHIKSVFYIITFYIRGCKLPTVLLHVILKQNFEKNVLLVCDFLEVFFLTYL